MLSIDVTALLDCHALDVLHCDLSNNNVMWTKDGQGRLIDVDLAILILLDKTKMVGQRSVSCALSRCSSCPLARLQHHLICLVVFLCRAHDPSSPACCSRKAFTNLTSITRSNSSFMCCCTTG